MSNVVPMRERQRFAVTVVRAQRHHIYARDVREAQTIARSMFPERREVGQLGTHILSIEPEEGA